MLKAALACGLIPMAAGTAIFGAWFLTGAEWLELAGLILISLGQMLVLAGITCLVVYVVRAVRSGGSWRRPVLTRLAVLLLNFPLCLLYVTLAVAVKDADLVTLRNASGIPVDSLTLTGPGGGVDRFGPVAPGETRVYCTQFSGEGAVRFTLSQGGAAEIGTAIGYTTSLIGSRAEMVVTGNGPPEITERAGGLTGLEFLRLCRG